MITIGLLVLCVFSSGFTGNIYKKLSHESSGCAVSSFMPSVWFFLLGILFSVFAFIEGFLKAVQIPIAMAAGICIYAAVTILIESMKSNAMSISIIIMNLNFMIPVVLSAIFLRENTAPIQMIGMIVSIVVIFLLNLKGDGRYARKGAVLLPMIACIANGLVNFLIKLNTGVCAEHKGGSNAFFAVMYLTAAICAILFSLAFARKEKKSFHEISCTALNRKTMPFMLMMGLCNGVCFYTTDLLAIRMNAAAQFTIVTAASIMISLVIGIIFQKEHLTWRIWLSLIFCLIAVMCQMCVLI